MAVRRGLRRLSFSLILGLLLGACGGGDGFTVDPTVEAGVNPYAYAWSPGEGSAEIERQFLLYVPDEYLADPAQPWPLVVYLHGFGRGPMDPPWSLEESATTGLPVVVAANPYRFLMVAPYASDDDFLDPEAWAWTWWTDYLADLVDHVGTLVSVDSDRIYVTGFSVGGYGAWALHSARPELPAAVLTLAGFWDETCMTCDWSEDWTTQYPANVCDMAETPTWVFHSMDDFVIDPAASQTMVDQLEACGGDVRHTWYDAAGHTIYWTVYTDPEVFDWMLSQGYEGDWPALPSDL